jgi:gluconate 2-dehydrogenase gamma chain
MKQGSGSRAQGSGTTESRKQKAESSENPQEMGMGRREALGVMAMVPVVAAWDWGGATAVEKAARAAEVAIGESSASGAAYAPKFFTAHEWKTVRVLADIVIPRDERSGSATDAGVPEFMDFMMTDRPSDQLPMRGGLAWLDAECRRRWKKSFVACSTPERTALLDDIAWPDKAAPESSQGVAFFNRFRDLTASGFFSSKMGVADLRYRGNTVVPVWKGCPDEALAKLGVSYGTKWDTNDDRPSRG